MTRTSNVDGSSGCENDWRSIIASSGFRVGALDARPFFDPHFAQTRVMMACSATKLGTAAAVPAWKLYRGPMWLTLRARLSEQQLEAGAIALSALYGWEAAGAHLAMYERRLSAEAADWQIARGLFGGCDTRAREGDKTRVHFNAFGSLAQALGDACGRAPVAQIIVAGAGHYRRVMRAGIEAARVAGLVARDAAVFTVAGGIGTQRQQLGALVGCVVSSPAARVAARGDL